MVHGKKWECRFIIVSNKSINQYYFHWKFRAPFDRFLKNLSLFKLRFKFDKSHVSCNSNCKHSSQRDRISCEKWCPLSSHNTISVVLHWKWRHILWNTYTEQTSKCIHVINKSLNNIWPRAEIYKCRIKR